MCVREMRYLEKNNERNESDIIAHSMDVEK